MNYELHACIHNCFDVCDRNFTIAIEEGGNDGDDHDDDDDDDDDDYDDDDDDDGYDDGDDNDDYDDGDDNDDGDGDYPMFSLFCGSEFRTCVNAFQMVTSRWWWC